jgi:hypothetical protein
MTDMDKHLEQVLQEKVATYTRVFGENALYEVIKEKESFYKFMGKDDYIEIAYYEDKQVKHIKLVGELGDYADYVIAKINSKHEVVVIKRIGGIYYPLEKIEVGEFL